MRTAILCETGLRERNSESCPPEFRSKPAANSSQNPASDIDRGASLPSGAGPLPHTRSRPQSATPLCESPCSKASAPRALRCSTFSLHPESIEPVRHRYPPKFLLLSHLKAQSYKSRRDAFPRDHLLRSSHRDSLARSDPRASNQG